MITQSSVLTYERCPKQWEYAYVEQVKRVPGKAVRGRAFHEAEAVNFREKMTTRRDLTVAQVQEAFAAALAAEFQAEQDVILDAEETRDSLQTSGLALTAYAATMLNPTIQPTLVEERAAVPFDDGLLSGQVDLVDDRNVIVDLKTASRRWPKTRAAYELQPPLYSLIYEQVTGMPPGGFQYQIVVDKAQPEIQAIEATPTEGQIVAAKQRVRGALQGMQLGHFPYRPSPQTCGWCGYRDLCPVGKVYVANGR